MTPRDSVQSSAFARPQLESAAALGRIAASLPRRRRRRLYWPGSERETTFRQGTDSIYIPACAKCDYSRSFCRPALSRRSRAYDRDAWHCSFTWSSGVTASQATRMSNLDHDMLSMFLVAFRMRRKLAQVSLNQHGPSTSRSACAALRTRMAARQERVGELLCASPLARTAAAQRAPLAGLTSAATPAQHCACSAACTAAHTSLTRVLCPSFRSAQSELLYVELCLAAVRAFCSRLCLLCMVVRSFSSWVFGRHLAAVTHLCAYKRVRRHHCTLDHFFCSTDA